MVDFGGMGNAYPISGAEHLWTRSQCGIFDVSHMGLIEEKDLVHTHREAEQYRVAIADDTFRCAAIAVQGPRSEAILKVRSGSLEITGSKRTCLGIADLEEYRAWIPRTGYTGGPSVLRSMSKPTIPSGCGSSPGAWCKFYSEAVRRSPVCTGKRFGRGNNGSARYIPM